MRRSEDKRERERCFYFHRGNNLWSWRNWSATFIAELKIKWSTGDCFENLIESVDFGLFGL